MKSWQERLPFLHQEIEKGNIHCFDGRGISHELSEENKAEIQRLENTLRDLKVVAVIDAKYKFPDDMVLHFVDYLLLGDDTVDISEDDPELVTMLSYTKNIDDDECSEIGYVGVKEQLGLLKRVY